MTTFPANADRDALIDDTLRVFQPRTSRRLTREDAREIITNMTGMFSLLLEWDRKAREKEAKAERAATAGATSPQPGDPA